VSGVAGPFAISQQAGRALGHAQLDAIDDAAPTVTPPTSKKSLDR
jgi:hypothetical protein